MTGRVSRGASLLWLVFLAAWPASSQTPEPNGSFHFVHLRLRQGEAAGVAIGSLELKSGAGEFSARQAIGNQAPAPVSGAARLGAHDSAAWLLGGVPDEASRLRIRASQDGGVLLGVADDAAAGSHDLLIAVRTPAGASPAPQGRYAGVYLRFLDGQSSGAETSQIGFATRGAAATNVSLMTHSAAWDDVNRLAALERAPFTVAADGTGSFQFGDGHGPLSGSMSWFASEGGAFVVGTSMDSPHRDLLVAVRDAADATDTAFTGAYWIAELGGESPYAFDAGGLQLSSADGLLLSTGNGRATIRERVLHAGRETGLQTSSRYLIGSGEGRALAAELTPRLRNLAVDQDFGIFIASWTRPEGELSLRHGLLMGLKAPQTTAEAPPPVPGAFTVGPRGAESGVLHADGEPVTAQRPAGPGDSVLVLLTPLDPGAPLDGLTENNVRVLFNGVEGAIESAGADPDGSGQYQIRVTVPDQASVNGQVVLGVATASTYNDLTELTVAR